MISCHPRKSEAVPGNGRAFMQPAAGRMLECVMLNEQASAGAPPLVFLHEGLGSVALWRDFPAAVAAETDRRALVYSRYGYGQSDVLQEPFDTAYMHDEGTIALPGLLESLGLEKPILIGHSDGASIALLHAGLSGRKVAGLVLMAPHVFVEQISVTSIATIGEQFEHSDMAEKLGRYHRDPVRTFRGWNDIWLHPAFRDWNIEDCLPAIDCPVLVIQGENDEYGTADQVLAIEQGVSGPCSTVMLPDCGHSPHRDRRDQVLHAIGDFVGRLQGGIQ